MKHHLTSIMAIGLAALMLGTFSLAPANAQGGSCLGNREIQGAIAAGEILPLANALAAAGIDGSRNVLSVKVCEQGGRYVYVVAVLNASGEAENLTVRAN